MTQDKLYEEYGLWLEAHGLHDAEEPPEDTFVGYDEDGEETYLDDVPSFQVIIDRLPEDAFDRLLADIKELAEGGTDEIQG